MGPGEPQPSKQAEAKASQLYAILSFQVPYTTQTASLPDLLTHTFTRLHNKDLYVQLLQLQYERRERVYSRRGVLRRELHRCQLRLASRCDVSAEWAGHEASLEAIQLDSDVRKCEVVPALCLLQLYKFKSRKHEVPLRNTCTVREAKRAKRREEPARVVSSHDGKRYTVLEKNNTNADVESTPPPPKKNHRRCPSSTRKQKEATALRRRSAQQYNTRLQPQPSPPTKIQLIRPQLQRDARIPHQRDTITEEVPRPEQTAFDPIDLLLENAARGVAGEDHERPHGSVAGMQVLVQTAGEVVGFEDEQDDARHAAEEGDDLFDQALA
ncbi:hypothetical protein KC359_g220 [Hortaea werneckii]|nr:hypothetical protein KC359_g220 [Hortaea werneckii]